MKSLTSNVIRRSFALSVVGLAGLLAAGCALPEKEAWAQIQQRGLIPVLIDGRPTEVASNTAKPSGQNAVRVQAVSNPVVVKTVYADAVPGQPGYVYSPHTSPRKVVDVRGYRSGVEVRCPFTAQPFLVPDFNAVAAASKPSPVRPVHAAEEVVSNSPATTLLDESLARLEPVVEPPVAPPNPAEPVRIDSTPAARPEIPYGTRVAGRPGFVNSPYAAKSQLVDVSRYAPGVLVKCPYTNKMFRVPEMHAEEAKPSTVPAPPPGEPAETPPAVSPDNPVPSPVEPAPPLSSGSSPDNPR